MQRGRLSFVPFLVLSVLACESSGSSSPLFFETITPPVFIDP